MFRGFYTVASGMLAQQRRTEMLTNNMSNSNTPGFKADQAAMRAFPEMLLQRYDQTAPNGTGKEVGAINTGVYMQEAMPKFIQGDMRETGKKTDIALVDVAMPADEETGMSGSVLFTVRLPDGTVRYTRNGNFTLDGQGSLTTASGQYILDRQGNPIQLSSDQFTISETGIVTGQNGETAQLGIGFAGNPNQLIKEGSGLFRTENGEALPDAAETNGAQFKLQQGFLEQSNVDLSQTMTEMLTAYRAFEANQKVLQAYDQSMQKAANEIGRL
ncbi:flagellar hook-basal body protein [Mesobacillus foraminis]|uniref:flagellar hook-basal body protein n=1 Tax=Mesobacillus foraminis TaxID=279826 RepID=UPI000EF45E9E|nr:flagellar hook-basal body protein [Mesobacillus foraminis]